ncbi:endonuclease domain-containing protein [Sphingomonas lacunae]|nr:endonuclease domain-containing protein [Sphingomonas lacunae]
MTVPEVKLWQELRKRPDGLKFRRQHPAGPYIIDFYCAAARLAIEIDGAAHDNAARIQSDERRSVFLREQHIATMRVPAEAVMENFDGAVLRILSVCRERSDRIASEGRAPLHHPLDGPPPRSGEDQ